MSKKGANILVAENCNKAMCNTCIFKTDGNELPLNPGRLDEIKLQIVSSASHICHTTEKTCYGALQYQADVFFKFGFIKENTVDCFLKTVEETLKITV